MLIKLIIKILINKLIYGGSMFTLPTIICHAKYIHQGNMFIILVFFVEKKISKYVFNITIESNATNIVSTNFTKSLNNNILSLKLAMKLIYFFSSLFTNCIS